jgi:hypothetical protein
VIQHTSRRRARRILGAVLPLLLLRVLVPAGFMPVAGPGGLSVGLCPGEAAMAAGSHPRHVSDGVRHGGPAPAGEHRVPCLFAASAAAAFAPAAVSLPVADLRPIAPAAATPATRSEPSIYRAQSPRAPPAATA